MKTLLKCTAVLSASLLLASCTVKSEASIPNVPMKQLSMSGNTYLTPNKATINAVINILSPEGKVIATTVSDEEGFFDIDIEIPDAMQPLKIVASGSVDGQKIALSRMVDSDDFANTLDVNLITTLATQYYSRGQDNLDLAFTKASESLGLKIPGRELRDDSYFIDLSDLDSSQFSVLNLPLALNKYIVAGQSYSSKKVSAQSIPSRTYRKLLSSALVTGVGALADLGQATGAFEAAKPFFEEYLGDKFNISSPSIDLSSVVSEIAKLKYELSSATASSTLSNELRLLSFQEDLFRSLLKNDIEKLGRLGGQKDSQLRKRIQAEEDADAIIQNHSALQAILFNQSNGLDGQNQKLILDYSKTLKPFGLNENGQDVGRRRVTAPRGLIEAYLAERILENGDDYFNFSFAKEGLLNNGVYYTNTEALKNRYLIVDESDAIEATNLFRNYISQEAYLISRSINLLRKISGYKNKDKLYVDYFLGLSDLKRKRLESAISQYPMLTQDQINSFSDSTVLTFETETNKYTSIFKYFINTPYRVDIDMGDSKDKTTISMKFQRYFPSNVISSSNRIVTDGYFAQNGTGGTQHKTFPTIIIDSQLKKAALWACANAEYVPQNQYESNIFDYPNDGPTSKQPAYYLDAWPALGSVAGEGWRRPDAKIVSKMDSTYESNPLVSLTLIQHMCNFSLQSEGDTIKTAVLLSGASTYKGSFIETKNGRPGVLKINQNTISSQLPPVLDAHISAPETYESYDSTRQIYKVGFSSKYNIILPLYLADYDLLPFNEK